MFVNRHILTAKMKHKNYKQHLLGRQSAGDTIIEVLIAIAVAGSVLAIVFSTSSRNLRTARDIQERSEASRLVQGQIESLRYAKNNGVTLPGAGTPFCMDGSTVESNFNPAATVPASTLVAENFSLWPPLGKCRNGFYNYVIETLPANTYRIYARWDSVSLSGRDQIIMVYRVN